MIHVRLDQIRIPILPVVAGVAISAGLPIPSRAAIRSILLEGVVGEPDLGRLCYRHNTPYPTGLALR
jgi:hypothetical protein